IRARSPPPVPLPSGISGHRNPVPPSSKKGKTMKPRLQFFNVAPALLKQVQALNQAVEECGLEISLLHLIKLRASQINGCSFCVDMHSKEALRDGDTLQRV